MVDEQLSFEVETPLGYSVRCIQVYWQIITRVKHPVMAGRLAEVKQTLEAPDEIRQSKRDANVYLFYRVDAKRWVCAVTRRLNGDGFSITAYPTDAIKEGERVWNR